MASIFIINDMTQKERNQKNRDKILASNKKNNDKWKEVRKEAVKKYHKQRKQSDPLFRLKGNISSLLSNTFKNTGHKKTSKTSIILGCTLDEFRQHIESQFEPWMTWDNYGCKSPSGPDTTWDLDHIIPVSSAVNEDDIKRLNHYTNFQPLCSFQNRFIKRDRVM